MINRIKSGEMVIMSDDMLDRYEPYFTDDIVSFINPKQVGLLDRYCVCLKSHPEAVKFRKSIGVE